MNYLALNRFLFRIPLSGEKWHHHTLVPPFVFRAPVTEGKLGIEVDSMVCFNDFLITMISHALKRPETALL